MIYAALYRTLITMDATEACQAMHLSMYTVLVALTLSLPTHTLLWTAGNASYCNANRNANFNNVLLT
jgi:hypothetical protein